MLIGKIILIMLSFAGLSGGIRTVFKADRYVAPSIAACSIIVLLNIGGMLGLLLPVWILLYALGFSGAIYAYIVKRSTPEWLQLGFYAALVVLLILRFGGTYLYVNDDVSHWSLVARFLLRYDSFPNAKASFIKFQSYPLGTACFIYYLCRGTINTEGAYLVAQNFLQGVLFLPVLQYIHKSKRKHMMLFSTAVFLVLLHFCHKISTLQVDHLLGFFGILIFTLLYLYRQDARKLTTALLPCLLAIVTIKSSGLAFSIMTAVGLWASSMKRSGKQKLSPLAITLLGVLPVAHYLLWVLRIKAVYAQALETKHAVSAAAYLGRIKEKGVSTIASIATSYLKAMVTPTRLGILAILCLAGFAILILMLASKRGAVPSAVKRMALNGCVYLLWNLLLLMMYIVSMPTSEALKLASFDRYNMTGLIILIGLFLLQLEMEWNLAQDMPKQTSLLMNCTSVALIAGVVALYTILLLGFHSAHFDIKNQPSSFRAALQQAKADHQLPDGEAYLICYPAHTANSEEAMQRFNTIKYEFETSSIYAVMDDIDRNTFKVGTWAEQYETLTPSDFMFKYADQCKACIILKRDDKKDDAYDAFINGYAGSTPVYIFNYSAAGIGLDRHGALP